MNNRDLIIQSFQIYYKTNVSSLILFAKRFIPSGVAEDLVHDVFLEAWKSIKDNEEIPSKPYLFMAVRNKCINFLKRELVKQNYEESILQENTLLGLESYDSHEKLIIERENIQEIYHEIEKLPEKCRVIFKMSYFKEKKSAEIATILNVSIRTVEHQLYLGLKTLRSVLTQKGKKICFFYYSFK